LSQVDHVLLMFERHPGPGGALGRAAPPRGPSGPPPPPWVTKTRGTLLVERKNYKNLVNYLA
jgi:hypothetical protein